VSILGDAFSYLANVFSGRIRHWTTAHNVTLSQQWAKVEKLSPPFDGIFKQFLVAAGIVVESFFGPNRKSEKIQAHGVAFLETSMGGAAVLCAAGAGPCPAIAPVSPRQKSM